MSDQLIKVLEDTAGLLRQTQVNLKKCPKLRLTKGYLETRIEVVEGYWRLFKSTHQELLKCTPREKRGEISYFLNEEYYIIEDLYLCLQGDLKDTLYAVVQVAQPKGITSSDVSMGESLPVHPHVKLPAISLPVFAGNYEEWPTFHDLFKSLVHNNTSLSKVQKLHYLKSSITGEAAALLKHITITEQNYEQACKTLKDRYGNNKLIVNSLLKRLFGQKKSTGQTASQIKSLLDTTTECLNNLQNLKVSIESWDPIIIFLVVQKLDPETHKAWEEHSYTTAADELPTWPDLKKFLESKFRTLELVNPGTTTVARDRPIFKDKSFHVSAPAKTCVMCEEEHNLYHCKEFSRLVPVERMEYVKKTNLCFNCLFPGHSAIRCRLPVSCRICKKRHHTLIHQAQSTELENTEVHHSEIAQHADPNHEEEGETVKISSNFACKKSTALLATALVSVKDEDGHVTSLRALIDQGSQSSFISERAAQALRIKRLPAKGTVTGVGSTQTNINSMAHLEISSRYDEEFKLPIKVYIMGSKLTSQLPTSLINYTPHTWPHINGLTLADPCFNQPGRVDMLLGVEVCAQIFKSKIIKGPAGSPCAQDTSLGWILFGNVDNKTAGTSHEPIVVMHHQVNVDDMLRTFWEVDTTETKKCLTSEEECCETTYKETHARDKEGRYIVTLPFKTKEPKSPLGHTRDIAMLRLKQLEKRFEKDPKLKNDYVNAMEELIELNYIEEVPQEELNDEAVYLPHHAVIKEEKDTTKTRIVFNASSKGSNDVSLNDELLVGPHLQEDMRNIVMRWRMRRIAIVADIKKMYLQILMNDKDTAYQRILWRKDVNDPIKDYRLLRVTFGTASAPYLAVKTLQQVAEDEGREFPTASQIIREDFFMDDLMTGRDNVTEAVETAKQIDMILKRGGFTLQKWASNSTEFLKEFDPSERSTHVKIDLELDGTIKALGLCWNMGEDTFYYTLHLSTIPAVITKRKILAEIQRLFDPLGWLAPALLPAKIIIQKLWLLNVGWDQEVNENIKEEWLHIRESLEHLKDIKLNRWLKTTQESIKDVTIHGFCDASTHAYGAVAFLRVPAEDGEPKTFLLAARTRVAPVKPMTVPRLELCGAVLLSKLMKQISEATRIPTTQMFAWTDSKIVLAWLQGDPTRWQTFVRNRVVTILDNIGNRWYHVQSKDNPADLASRGMLLDELKSCDLWWQGPQWLKEKDVKLEKPEVENMDLEKRVNIINANLKINETKEAYKPLPKKLEEFVTLPELLKSVACCKRFLLYLKEKNMNMTRTVSTEELDTALQIIVQVSQRESFREEIESVREGNTISKKSKIKSLNAYLDDKNILRVGGRLRHAALSDERKHPMILDKCHLSALIIADAHQRTLHGRVQLTLNYIRSKYWIIKDKNMVKFHVRKCLICARLNAATRHQLMGDLPKERVTPARPFLNSGVDFAGPYQILMSKGRGAKTCKAYIALFICMATKAIHLELVSDLTSEAFIGAFRRFVARRGRCNHLWSDQGRNFVGASKELVDSCQEARLDLDDEVAEKLALDGTQWHFIPAYSPNFGGLWEAGVKAMKYHLRRILNTNLTYEEMSTILCQIEACLNSRPLCAISDKDSEDLEVLTPGHFLIGEAPINVPSPFLRDSSASSLGRWRHTQKIIHDFWRQWQQEYLTRLQQRPKWVKRQDELHVGQIVLIKNDNLPPGKWQLGRIVHKHPGADNITRVYSVKSGESIVKRPITKLCLMPIDTDS